VLVPHIPSARGLAISAVLAAAFAVLPVPAVALGPPETLAAARTLGTLEGTADPVDPAFPVDYLVVSWLDGGDRPEVRFRTEVGWSSWHRIVLDEVPTTDGRTYSRLVSGDDAYVYQVRGKARDVEAVAINTTDGPREPLWQQPEAEASHLAQPAVVSRPAWGANEDLRFTNATTEKCTRTFYPTEKLIVHHTVTVNDDPDPAATVRAIYYDHVVNRGFCDIAYNFLVSSSGQIFKGRYSGPQNTKNQDTLTGENAQGLGVTGGHTAGWNSGTMGIALLGNYVSTPITEPARQALVNHLAWEAERHGLDPLATTAFTNPSGGATKTAPNISGHRDWTPTACPGENLYQTLPAIRQEVAAHTGAIAKADTKAPRIRRIREADVGRRFAEIKWRTSEPATEQVLFWRPGGKRRTTPLDPTRVNSHQVRLTGLKRGTKYLYRVMSWDAAGNRAVSGKQDFTTAV
jgi:N-acetylmuramoyl-L-alanine amidase